jgi:DNA-binding NarL/FixJ family response regulator
MATTRSTTVLLVDAPRAVREALRARLSLEPGLEIVGEADDCVRAISLAQALAPDVALLDAEADDLDTPRLVHALAAHNPLPRIVVLTQHTVAVSRHLAGTRVTIVGKQEGLPALVRAIRSATTPSGPC